MPLYRYLHLHPGATINAALLGKGFPSIFGRFHGICSFANFQSCRRRMSEKGLFRFALKHRFSSFNLTICHSGNWSDDWPTMLRLNSARVGAFSCFNQARSNLGRGRRCCGVRDRRSNRLRRSLRSRLRERPRRLSWLRDLLLFSRDRRRTRLLDRDRFRLLPSSGWFGCCIGGGGGWGGSC